MYGVTFAPADTDVADDDVDEWGELGSEEEVRQLARTCASVNARLMRREEDGRWVPVQTKR